MNKSNSYEKLSAITAIVKIVTILFSLFSIMYGLIFISVKLESTINFDNIDAAILARKEQILFCLPFIILGIILLITVIMTSKINLIVNIQKSLTYKIALAVISLSLIVYSVIIAFYLNEIYLLICIIPNCLLVIYVFRLIIKRMSNSN